MKKIGYVIPSFPVLSETFVGVEMRAMMRKGHQVQPFAFTKTEHCQPADTMLAECCQYIPKQLTPRAVLALPALIRCHSFLCQQTGFSYLSLLKQGLILAEMAKRERCEHLHAHFAWHSAATAIVAARILNISVSFVGHGADIYASPQDLATKLQHVDFSCAVTNNMRHHLQKMTQRPVHYVACGIETADYPTLNAAWKPDATFLFIGRLVEKKDLNTLLTAFQQLPTNSRLDIVGDGPLRQQVERWINQCEMQKRVRLLGAQPSTWLRRHAEHYRALVVPFCIAKDGDRDTGPLVVKEAMALGLPVITSNLPGCNEIVDEQAGVRVPMRNPEALSSAMLDVLNHAVQHLNEQRQYAYQHVMTHYNADIHAGRLSSVVERL
ncbi:glycosyltransferase family 4 protein [Thaumasiovibrio sp. DFM-14]|uniref:glycosyltransferase family 4 protein n=1 Tax=Thaumasiovibrio sp. DFM-14 TaxID=3384792 RepID=UPI0039A2FF54